MNDRDSALQLRGPETEFLLPAVNYSTSFEKWDAKFRIVRSIFEK